jgi:hypothetical protein
MRLERQTVLYGFSGVGALLGIALIYQLVVPLPDLDPPLLGIKPRTAQIAAVMPVSTPPAETFAAIDQRPMFTPSRKPAVAAAANGEATLQPPDIALVGIMIDSRDRMAMIRTPSAPLATAYHLGANIAGWQLSEIAPDRIVLIAGGARDEIKLESNKPLPKQPQPPGPPPPPGSSQ